MATEKKEKDEKKKGATAKGKEAELKEKEKKDEVEEKVIKQTHGAVRVLEYTLSGDKKVESAIRDIKGVGHRIALLLANKLNLRNKLLGDLSEDEILHLEEGLKNISNIALPWMLNHRNEQFTGLNMHFIGTDLDVAIKRDIEFMQKIRCYKGIRHMQGQPVRGQRTRTSFRKGRIVGVIRKKTAQAQAAKKDEKKGSEKTAKK